MDDKKKLVELLSQVQSSGMKQGSHITHQEWKTNEEIADHLIANGVTVLDAFGAKAGEDQNAKCKCCIHKEACLAWIRHGKALYEDFVFSTESCPYFESIGGKWIPVTERLPEVEGEYITYTDKEQIHFDCFCIYPEHGTRFLVGGNGKITHWMPLPEPPKGGQNDGR